MSGAFANTILLRGCSGAGKTYRAKAVAYYLCEKGMDTLSAISVDPSNDLDAIEAFFRSDRCEYVQVHPSMDYNDLIYGPNITTTGGMSMHSEAKRLVEICRRACKSNKSFCIILDDIDRVDITSLLGELLYGIEHRNENYRIGHLSVCVPDNLLVIATEGGMLIPSARTQGALGFMSTHAIKSDRDELRQYYSKTGDSHLAQVVLDLFDNVNNVLRSRTNASNLTRPITIGHGYFIVPITGTPHMILRKIRERYDYQIVPYISELARNGLVDVKGSDFERLANHINVGALPVDAVKSIEKRFDGSNTKISSTLADISTYFANTLAPSTEGGVHRWVFEYLIDAILQNGILPQGVALTCLLTNTNLGRLPSPKRPGIMGSFVLNKNQAHLFEYTTPPRGTRTTRVPHGYYGRKPSGCSVAPHNETSVYHVEYSDGSYGDFYPLSGVRSHSFSLSSISSPELGTLNNTAVHLRAVYMLISGYLSLYEESLKLQPKQSGDDNLASYLNLEKRYLDSIPDALANSGVANDAPKTAFFCERLTKIRSLWSPADSYLDISESLFRSLVNGQTPFTTQAFEDLFTPRPSDVLRIKLRRIDQMIDIKDYQAVMENIGVRQMIYQGPPGTSKTFDAKRFVLSQLDPSNPILANPAATQQDISTALEVYRLDNADYADPSSSNKLSTGGWDLVQFHPSYGYEDFVRGIDVDVVNGTPNYRTANRIIGQIAEFARCAKQGSPNSGSKFYLIVDEINRANLATVFGELIYGLEYRDSSVATPYQIDDKATNSSTRNITLSSNLFLIGTMNTADKTIDSLDYAIRRRFIFVDCPPRRDVVLSLYQNVSGKTDEESIELLLFDAVQNLFDNDVFFNNDYRKEDVKIGHTFFLRTSQSKYLDDCVERFIFQVIPIIREYIKDGIFEQIEDVSILEHTPTEICSASGSARVALLGESIMAMAQNFNSSSSSSATIDNEYVCKFITSICEDLGW